MIRKLEEEDKDLRQQSAHAPYDHLKQPYSNINRIVRVNVIISINWHALIRINSTFELLKKKDKRSSEPENAKRFMD